MLQSAFLPRGAVVGQAVPTRDAEAARSILPRPFFGLELTYFLATFHAILYSLPLT